MSPFTPKDWRNDPDHTTPLNAVALEDLEERVAWGAQDVFNARSYGFVGDADDTGGTDDTTAINDTLAAADAAGGGLVILPTPCLTQGSHEVPPGVTVSGLGRQLANIYHRGATYCFQLMDETSGGRGCGLQHLSIIGATASLSAVAGGHAVEVSNGQQHRLDDIYIYGFTNAGKGIVFRNRNGTVEYVEQTKGFGVTIVNCENLIEFIHDSSGGDSFGYTQLVGLQLQVYTNQTAISVGAGCNVYNSFFQGSLHYAGNGGTGVYVAATGQIWQGVRFQIVGEVLSGTGLRRINNDGIFHANGKFYIATLTLPGGDDITGASQHSFVEDQLTFAENDTMEIASAATITIPGGSSAWNVTGTTNITAINASWNGRIVTLKFGGSLTIGGGSMQLAGGANFSATDKDTLTLHSMSGVWREVARSVN